MRCTLSPGWTEYDGPPGSFCTGTFHAQNGTTSHFDAHWNQRLSGSLLTHRSNQLCLLGIGRTPAERTCNAAAPDARFLVGIAAGMQDRIAGSLNTRDETAGIETDVFGGGGLVVGDLVEGKRAHDNAEALGGP